MNIKRWLRRVQDGCVGGLGCDRQVGRPNPLVEVSILSLYPVSGWFSSRDEVARNVQEKHKVWLEPTHERRVDRLNSVHAKLQASSMVGECCIDEPINQHHRPCCGSDLIDQLTHC